MILVPIFRRLNHHRNLCTTRSSFILRKEPKPNPWIPNDGNIKYYMAIGLIPTGKKHALKKYDQFALNTSCFWGSCRSNITPVVQFH